MKRIAHAGDKTAKTYKPGLAMFNDLPRNTRVTLLLEPCSSVLACILTFYAALYMQANGLDARQIGLIATLAAATGLCFQVLAAPVVNRLGRRQSLLVTSLLCWSIPLLCWTLATGFTLFLVAALFFSVSRITGLAWYCVLTEDVDEARKARVFGLVFVIGIIGGLGTLAAGPVITRFGLAAAIRGLYGVAFVSMTAMFLLRHRALTETAAGVALTRDHAGRPWADSMRHHLGVVAATMADAEFRRLALTWVLFSFAQAMGFVFTLYYSDVLAFTAGQLSLLPPLAAVVGLVLYQVAIPRLDRIGDRIAIPGFLVLMAGGLTILLLAPVGWRSCIWFAAALSAAGAYLGNVAINAALNNRMGRLQKADAYSAVQLLAALGMVPAGWLAGWLFARDPRLALSGIVGILVLAALVHLVVSPARTVASSVPAGA